MSDPKVTAIEIVAVFLFLVAVVAAPVFFKAHAQPAGPPIEMYTLSIERLDFFSTDQQTTFQTNVPARSNYVEVYRNGLLLSATANPALTPPQAADYSTASITGHLQVIFSAPLQANDRVTLKYWR